MCYHRGMSSDRYDFLAALGLEPGSPGALTSFDPTTGAPIAGVRTVTTGDYEATVHRARGGFEAWRALPAPARGQVVRALGDTLRRHKEALGRIISAETGKILAEGLGEVQEAIDIADFAVGLSRQLYGLSMHSERPGHRMYEQWHPLGPVAVITAFNFPLAVWAWNAMIALVCGDSVVWKPSEQAPLTALATHGLLSRTLAEQGAPDGVLELLIGDVDTIARPMVADRRFPLVSFTGSCAVGREVAGVVGGRLGRSLLELGGNNAIVVLDDADLDLAVRALLFAAVGTAGQRCTSARRLLVQKGIAPRLLEALSAAYAQVRIGDPLAEGTLMGPLVSAAAVDRMMAVLQRAREEGAEVLYGGGRHSVADFPSGHFVQPTLVRAHEDVEVVAEETFAPILYAMEVDDLDHAIALNNSVDQGLSSAIFTRDLAAAERFLAASGADTGIANVNIGTSGAEIGGAFGGEKDTGGGREAGSDSWKAYMRRQTCTLNYSGALPLAQGIDFDL